MIVLLVIACIASYIILGAITMGLVARFVDFDFQAPDQFMITIFWPCALVVGMFYYPAIHIANFCGYVTRRISNKS